jgi:hypothetical protein
MALASRLRALPVAAGAAGLFALALAPWAADAAPSPAQVSVGVRGAAPARASFHGGPITGSADGSGSTAPVQCSDPSCEQIAIKLSAPRGMAPKEISLTATVTFSAPTGDPGGTTGLDLWLVDGSGTVLGSAVTGTSPAVVSVSGLSAGQYTLEVSGEAGATNETYRGVAAASVPELTPPARVGGRYATGVLPPAPASGLKGTNEDAEPGLAVDGNGTFWAASDIEPYAAKDKRALAALSGTDVWKSTDGGRSWQWVAAPFNDASTSHPGLGGEDSDIAVASAKNSKGFYNIYVASLWVGSTNIAVSTDGGKTWNVTPINGEPVDDRPWLAASGSCVFYLSYHAIAPYDTVVDKYNVCNNGQGIGSAVNPKRTRLFLGNLLPTASNRFGKQVVDNSPTSKYRGRIYVPMEGCALPSRDGAPEEGTSCNTVPKIFVGYSDNGSTYTDSMVAPVKTRKLFIWPDTIATDSAGNVYIAWFDDQHSYLAVSRNGGRSWSRPVQVNRAPARSSVYPTVAASRPGHVVVAFYGSTRAGDADNARIMGVPNTYGAAHWQLFVATSNDYGRHWSQTTATPTIHTGVLCYNGGGCGQYPGDRNLLDDFGAAISPTTGATVVVFSDDQPWGVNGKTHTDFAAQKLAAARTTAAVFRAAGGTQPANSSTAVRLAGRPRGPLAPVMATALFLLALAWRRRRQVVR